MRSNEDYKKGYFNGFGLGFVIGLIVMLAVVMASEIIRSAADAPRSGQNEVQIYDDYECVCKTKPRPPIQI